MDAAVFFSVFLKQHFGIGFVATDKSKRAKLNSKTDFIIYVKHKKDYKFKINKFCGASQNNYNVIIKVMGNLG